MNLRFAASRDGWDPVEYVICAACVYFVCPWETVNKMGDMLISTVMRY